MFRTRALLVAIGVVIGAGVIYLLVNLNRTQTGAADQSSVMITLRDNAFDPSVFTIEGGEGQRVTFTLVNRGAVVHDLSIPDLGLQSSEIAPGQTTSVDFDSSTEGTYRFVCTVPGHEQAGMAGYMTIK